MPTITARFPSTCRVCGKRILKGDTIIWNKGQKSAHLLCKDDGGKAPDETAEKMTVENVKLPASWKKDRERYFTIDWPDFKELMKDAAFNNRVSALKNPSNSSYINHTLDRSSFSGASRGQVQRWLSEGFQTDAIRDLAGFIPPIREKRRLRFLEEGDEMQIDLALSGADNYFTEWTKRETIPGVAIEASIMFAASVPAETVAAYNVWICKSAYSLESSGVDCQVTLDFPSRNLFREENGTLHHNIVRVKKENETSDFLSWSAMLSPASLRVFGFSLGAVHADAAGLSITSSFGNGIQDVQSWDVIYDEDRRVIRIQNAYSRGGKFPEEEMTRKLREVLKNLSN